VHKRLPTRVSTLLSQGYRPELDGSAELDPRRGQYCQSLIAVLRWICELGRIDIMVSVSMLSRYIVSPHYGHCKHHKQSTMVFDEMMPEFGERRFQDVDWSEYYPDAAEAILPNHPESRGNVVSTSCFADSDHAGYKVTRRSHTEILLFVGRAPIAWYLKRQNTVESSTFASEFIALKTAVDLIEGVRSSCE
jgi:hypothetical protein